MTCRYPQHHGAGRSGVALAAVMVAAVVIWRARHLIAEVFAWAAFVAVLAAAAVVVFFLARAVWQLRTGIPNWTQKPRSEVPRSAAGLPWLRQVPRALWAAARWHHLTRNLALAYPDKHAKGKVRRPRAIVVPSRHGVVAWVRTVPGSGRAEFDKAAEHISDYWRVQRVSVSRPRPGRLRVAGLRRDPLLEVLTRDDMPPARDLRHLYLGRDESGTHRFADLANVPGIVVGGMPGAGKSTEITSWIAQLAPSPAVQLVTLDGKGASEFEDFGPRVWLSEGDSLDGALDKLETVHQLMLDRLACVRSVLGVKNAWHKGPTVGWPLIVTVIDECQSYLDLTMVKGDRQLEPKVRRAIFLVSSLIRRGRSPMFLTIPATQKPTTDSLPSAIRDNCPVSLCFPVKTTDAAAATVGSSIRDYPSYSPAGLVLPDYTGVATVTLRTGQDPFTRLRGPYATEAEAAAVAAATAHLRKDPRAVMPVHVPDSPAELMDSPA